VAKPLVATYGASMSISREDVEFTSGDVLLRGWLYCSAETSPGPGIVMAHGLSAVREMFLDRYAEMFAKAGLPRSFMTTSALGRATVSRASARHRASNSKATGMPFRGWAISRPLMPTGSVSGARVSPAAR